MVGEPPSRSKVSETVVGSSPLTVVEGSGAGMRDDYLARLDAHLRWLEQGCERGGMLLVRSVSDDEPAGQLLDLLARLAGAPVDAVMHEGGGESGRGSRR